MHFKQKILFFKQYLSPEKVCSVGKVKTKLDNKALKSLNITLPCNETHQVANVILGTPMNIPLEKYDISSILYYILLFDNIFKT